MLGRFALRLRLGEWEAAGGEPAARILGGDGVEGAGAGVEQGVLGPRARAAQRPLELGEGQLDRVDVSELGRWSFPRSVEGSVKSARPAVKQRPARR